MSKSSVSFRDFADKMKSQKASPVMPVLFVGHGNPMNVLEGNKFGKVWEEIGANLPRPKVIVVMSAHWLTRGCYVTAMEKPRMIYDFYGFPEEMYNIQYLVPGDVELAQKIVSLNKHIKLDHEWGLDHGAWTVLYRMYKEAEIPVVQLSIDLSMSPREQYEMMRDIRSLREKGVLFIGSGNIVHNLSMLRMDGASYEWSIEFDEKVKELLLSKDFDRLIDYEWMGEVARLAIPTDDHYRPMLLSLGLVGKNEGIEFFNESIDLGSVSMRSFVVR